MKAYLVILVVFVSVFFLVNCRTKMLDKGGGNNLAYCSSNRHFMLRLPVIFAILDLIFF